jgi:hypothetical protein
MSQIEEILKNIKDGSEDIKEVSKLNDSEKIDYYIKKYKESIKENK